MNATYTTFYFDYQRYYTQKCRVQTKCCKSLYGGVHKRFLGQCVHTHFRTLTTLPCCVRIMFTPCCSCVMRWPDGV